jgi:signal transduction histidine kinase
MATDFRDIGRTLAVAGDVDAVLRQLPVGVLIAEAPGGRFVSVNERAEQIWGGELPWPTSIDEYSVLFTGHRSNGREYLSEEWPLARAVLHGEVVTDEEIEFRMPGGERRTMRMSAAPVLDADGTVLRAIALFHDITEQRQEERRRDFMIELGDELRVLDDAAAIMETAVVAAGEHLGVSSVSYADIDPGERYALVHAEYRNGRVVSTGKYVLEDFGPQLVERLRRGEAVALDDIASAREASPDVFEGWGIRSLVAAPIVRQGRLAAIFAVLHTVPRHWTRSDVALVEGVAARTYHAVESARVEADLLRSREWLTLALRAGAAAIWEWDLRTGHIHWSGEQGALLGVETTRRSLTFSRWLSLVHPDDRPAAREAGRRVATARDGDVEFEYRVAGAQAPRWVTMRGRVMSDTRGVPYRVVGVAVDTTERKSSELEREQLLREARESSDAKSHFISVISHEFRTPLTAIIGYTDLLSTGVSGELSPTQSRQLDRIRTSAWHLTQMVDEILTFSRLEAGRETVTFDVTDAAALAREAIALVAPGAAARNLALACELPDCTAQVRTDSGKLRQVLLNLLGNAIKFTEKGGITLRLRTIDAHVEFSVIDTGVGIAPEDLEHVFERFWQGARSSTHLVAGAGLGLTVSRRIVDLLGGRLTVESVQGAGSTFSFRLPLSAG